MYGEGVVDDSKGRKWFKKFCDNNFILNETPRSGRPTTADDDEILALIESARHSTFRPYFNDEWLVRPMYGCCMSYRANI